MQTREFCYATKFSFLCYFTSFFFQISKFSIFHLVLPLRKFYFCPDKLARITQHDRFFVFIDFIVIENFSNIQFASRGIRSKLGIPNGTIHVCRSLPMWWLHSPAKMACANKCGRRCLLQEKKSIDIIIELVMGLITLSTHNDPTTFLIRWKFQWFECAKPQIYIYTTSRHKKLQLKWSDWKQNETIRRDIWNNIWMGLPNLP